MNCADHPFMDDLVLHSTSMQL